jgi:hypothetical protein
MKIKVLLEDLQIVYDNYESNNELFEEMYKWSYLYQMAKQRANEFPMPADRVMKVARKNVDILYPQCFDITTKVMKFWIDIHSIDKPKLYANSVFNVGKKQISDYYFNVDEERIEAYDDYDDYFNLFYRVLNNWGGVKVDINKFTNYMIMLLEKYYPKEFYEYFLEVFSNLFIMGILNDEIKIEKSTGAKVEKLFYKDGFDPEGIIIELDLEEKYKEWVSSKNYTYLYDYFDNSNDLLKQLSENAPESYKGKMLKQFIAYEFLPLYIQDHGDAIMPLLKANKKIIKRMSLAETVKEKIVSINLAINAVHSNGYVLEDYNEYSGGNPIDVGLLHDLSKNDEKYSNEWNKLLKLEGIKV